MALVGNISPRYWRRSRISEGSWASRSGSTTKCLGLAATGRVLDRGQAAGPGGRGSAEGLARGGRRRRD
ncbi:hypothetical protein ABTL91_19345, partial [Acinetobacter baumannii]